jgi:hypothetical protein
MNTKTMLSFVFSATLVLAIIGNLILAKNMALAAVLVLAVLGVGILSHLAFFEEKKKRKNGVGAASFLNLAMTYGTLLMSLVSLFLLLLSPDSQAQEQTIAKAGQVAGDETEGSKIPLSDRTNVDSGGERAKLGSSGRGEGEETLGGANEDNQNAMREAQVHDPDIAGANQGDSDKTKVSARNVQEVIEPGESDLGLANATDNSIERVGEDDENKDIGDPNALLFDEDHENTLAFDDTVLSGENERPLDIPKAKGKTVQNVGLALNSLGIALPKSMSGRCDKLGRVSRLTRAGVRKPDSVERAVIKALNWLTINQNEDGSWGKTSKGAMTGFALLSYLGHCELTDSPEYGEAVAKGIKYLVELGDEKDGWLYVTNNKHGASYAQGIATYAMAEAYGMTEKDFILPILQKAIRRIVNGQKEDGGWYYLETRQGPDNLRFDDFAKNKNSASDTSVSGWQFQALKAAYNTGAVFPGLEPALEAAVKNFYRVYSPKNGGFGYRKASDTNNIKHKLTGVGSLGLQSWKHGHPSSEQKEDTLKKAMQHILKNNQGMDYNSGDANLYSWYYDTQALYNHGGAYWSSWNRRMEPLLIAAQSEDGSWPNEGSGLTKKRSQGDHEVYRTALCTLMLEVYYRYVY